MTDETKQKTVHELRIEASPLYLIEKALYQKAYYEHNKEKMQKYNREYHRAYRAKQKALKQAEKE